MDVHPEPLPAANDLAPNEKHRRPVLLPSWQGANLCLSFVFDAVTEVRQTNITYQIKES
jgi:hypothetical protein